MTTSKPEIDVNIADRDVTALEFPGFTVGDQLRDAAAWLDAHPGYVLGFCTNPVSDSLMVFWKPEDAAAKCERTGRGEQ